MGEEPAKDLVVKFMEAYWRRFHADDVGMRYFKHLIERIERSDNPYNMLKEWDAKDNAPFTTSQDKVNNAAGTLVGEHRRNGVTGLQLLIDEWNEKSPETLRKLRRRRPKQNKPGFRFRDYDERNQDKDYEPRDFS